MPSPMKLERVLHFPRGYTVRIRFLPHDEYLDESEGDTSAVAFFEYEEDTRRGGAILLDKSRSLADLVDDLDHELDHVCVEWREHWRRTTREKLKALVTG